MGTSLNPPSFDGAEVQNGHVGSVFGLPSKFAEDLIHGRMIKIIAAKRRMRIMVTSYFGNTKLMRNLLRTSQTNSTFGTNIY